MRVTGNVLCNLILFFIVFGLRFFCSNCQRFPPQQLQKFQQQIPLQIQKDLLSADNRLQSQVLRSTPTVVIQDATASGGGQKEHVIDLSHINNINTEQLEISQAQRCPGKKCKRKRRPQLQISTTETPPLIPQKQYWHGHIKDKQPRGRQRHQPSEASPTQISERICEHGTTKFSERIGEPFYSSVSEIIQQPSPTQVSVINNDALPLGYADTVRKPVLTIYSKKIREPTKEPLIVQHPITSTVFHKILEASSTRISEKNRESFSTKSRDKVLQEVSHSSVFERIREPVPKTTFQRNRESIPIRNSKRIREPLAAVEKENKKLFELRDKQHQEFIGEVTSGYRDKSYHRPYSKTEKVSTQQPYVSKEEPEILSTSQRSPTKKSEGLSISEILQQKNPFLKDLLNGKQNVVLAQQTKTAAPRKPESNFREYIVKPISSTSTTTSTTTTETTISDLSAEESSRQSGETQELLSGEVVSAIRKPSRIRTGPRTSREQHSDMTIQQRFSTTTTMITKPSTARILPYNKRQHIKPSLIKIQSFKKLDSTPTSGQSESKEARSSAESRGNSSTLDYPKRSRFRPTSAITPEPIVDQTDPAVNFVEDSGENEVHQQSVDVDKSSFTDKNHSMIAVHDQEQIETENQEEPTIDHIYRYNLLKNYIDKNPLQAVFMDIDLDDIDPVDDRTDLLELTEDRRSDNRLIKVLEQRNVSLEELIEHRKRGSSQLHLVSFVQNRSGVYPGKKVVVNDDMDIVTAFENFPHFNLLNFKSVKLADSQDSSYSTSIIDIEQTDEVFKDGSGADATALRNSSIRNLSQPFYPSWKSLALASLTTAENSKRFQQRSDPKQPQQIAQRHKSADIEEDSVLQIEHEVARGHDLVDLELSGHGFKRSAMNLIQTSQMPPGIRSAVVATAAVVLTSLVALMVIFVARRWKQRRRRRKLDYMEIYNEMKSKLSVISSRQTDELATSTTTLGMECVPSRASRSNSCQSQHHQVSIVLPGGGGGYLSETPVSPPSFKPSIMDSNSPEVRGYLYDALRKSF